MIQVADGEADINVPDNVCNHAMILTLNCAPAVQYKPYFWVSRFPHPTSKLWNILGLFTPGGWGMLLLTPFIIFGFFKLYKRIKIQMSYDREELLLIPGW